ncbi:hypothetical protein [Desulfotruncus alcoholivorax]|nr:hypothetical protein [Desulfotruncus alcoholivorax]
MMGIRLDISQLLASGSKIILLDTLVITFTITFWGGWGSDYP